MDNCYHACAGVPNCYLDNLDKLHKRSCRTVGPTLAASFESLAQRQDESNLRLLYSYFLGDLHLN